MRISDWSSDVCSSDLPSGRGCANSGVRATIAVFVQPTETMYRILTLAAASLAALLAFSACTSQAVLNDLTTDKGYTLTADVPYDREHHLTLDVYSPHNVQNAPVVVFFFGRRWQQGDKSQYKFVGKALEIGRAHV